MIDLGYANDGVGPLENHLRKKILMKLLSLFNFLFEYVGFVSYVFFYMLLYRCLDHILIFEILI